ncbi:MAG: dUTP diphosphatase [Kordiimonadaceae bacterium]|nr:dUTP diphosphatase [Kordiimonadaceae bacterium]
MSFDPLPNVSIEVKRLPHGEGLPLPKYETEDSAGMDLYAALAEGETITLGTLERAMIPTGLAMALPHRYEAQIRPRSGLAAKNGLTCLNTPGTIDADYRGEVKIILVNLSNEPFTIERGMRIAQMIIAPVTQGAWVEVDELGETERGTGGFGSTGVK